MTRRLKYFSNYQVEKKSAQKTLRRHYYEDEDYISKDKLKALLSKLNLGKGPGLSEFNKVRKEVNSSIPHEKGVDRGLVLALNTIIEQEMWSNPSTILDHMEMRRL